MPQKKNLRDPIVIGALALSVQASADHASVPQESGRPLSEYTHVEVTILQDGQPALPRDCGVPAFDVYFSEDAVARCLAMPVLFDLTAALEARA